MTEVIHDATIEKLTLPVYEGYTIDPKDAHERDDGFNIEWDQERQIFHVDVLIANPAASIDPYSLEAETIIERVATDYEERPVKQLLRGIIPNRICSLDDNGLKNSIVVSFDVRELDRALDPDSITVRQGLFKSKGVLSYEEANKALAFGTDDLSIESALSSASELHRTLHHDDNGRGFVKSEILIETLMQEASKALAFYFEKNGIPAIYRNYIEAQSIDQLLRDPYLDGTPMQAQLLKLILKNKRAYYSTHPVAHEAIDTETYMHCTSPIRRAVDIVNMWNLNAYLNGQPIPFQGPRLHRAIDFMNRHLILHGISASERKMRRRMRLGREYSQGSEEILAYMPSILKHVITYQLSLGRPVSTAHLRQYAILARQGGLSESDFANVYSDFMDRIPIDRIIGRFMRIMGQSSTERRFVHPWIDSLIQTDELTEKGVRIAFPSDGDMLFLHPIAQYEVGAQILEQKDAEFTIERSCNHLIFEKYNGERKFIELPRDQQYLFRFLNLFQFRFVINGLEERDVFVVADASRYAKRIARREFFMNEVGGRRAVQFKNVVLFD